MQNLLVFLATAEPSPGEELREGLDPEMVTPGTLGFLATLFVVIATVFLIRDMAKRIRRVRYREQVQANLQDDGAGDGADNDADAAGREDDGAHTDGANTDGGGQEDRAGDGGATERRTDDAERHTQDSNRAGPDRKG